MKRTLLGLILAFMILATGCAGGVSPRHATQTAIAQATLAAAAPTPEPLGSQSNPLHLGYVADPADTTSFPAGSQLAARLAELNGYAIQLAPQADYPALMAALKAGQVQMAWLPPATAIAAQTSGAANAALIVNHYGVYAYGTQFMANVNLGAQSYFDPVTNTNAADPVTALGQFAGLRPCWVDPQSLAGYIVPAGILAQVGVTSTPAVWSQSSTAVIRSLYVDGVCDFGATFSISGDPRTSSEILNDLPDVMTRVKIIWRSDALIPNLSLSYASAIDDHMARQLTDSWLELNNEPEALGWLTSMLAYDIQALRPVSNSYFDALHSYLDSLQIDPNTLIGK